MKKSLLTLLGAGLLLTSCQSDEPFAPVEGGEKQVTFTLNVPGELGTRADFGENKSDKGGLSNNAGELSYTLVLYADGDQRTFTQKGAGSVVFNPTVVLGRNYTVTAYAHFGNAWDGKTAIDITKHFNDETKDAYFKQEKIKFELNETSKQITLKRPFGKLRLLATDYTATGNQLNTAVKSVKIEYLDRDAAAFDPITQYFTSVDKNNDGVADEYANIENALNFGYYAAEDGAMPIFADYVPANPGDNMVDFTVEVTYTNDEKYSRTFNDIPVKRNALTTLKGNFFTAEAEIKVEVKDAFEGQIPGNAEEQLRMVAIMGGSYTLPCNITLSKPLKVEADMTLNLNGKTITGTMPKDDGAVIKVAEGASLKVIGGTIKNTTPNGDAAINNAGELVLENITIEGAPLADGGYSAYAVISSGKLTIGEGVNVSADRGCLKFSGAGETVINGGNFKNNDIGSRSLTTHVVDVEDGGSHKLTINGGTFVHRHTATSGGVVICNRTTGTVYVNGGNFSGGNYYGNDNLSDYGYGGTFVVTGGTYSARPAAKYIAAGYNVVVKDSKYYVVPEEAAVVTTAEELGEAINEGKTTIALTAGTYVIPADAKGKTLTFVGTGNPEDVEVAVTKVGTGGENCDYGLDGSNVTFDGVTITTNSSTYIGYARCNGTYKNCVINGTYTLYGNSVFENCTFNVSGDVYNIWTWGAPNATFENCTFNCDGKSMLLYGQANTKLTMNNCVFNDNGGLDELKAAIEIGNDYNKSYELIVNNATVNGFAINDKGIKTNTTLWANKNSMGKDKLNVVVDGVDVY